MKTILKSALTAIRRSAAHYRMRSIEINLAGAVETLRHVNDPLTHEHMRLAIREMSRSLCKARAEYIALLPAGRRITFDIA